MAFTLCSEVKEIPLCRPQCADCHIYKKYFGMLFDFLDIVIIFLPSTNFKLLYLHFNVSDFLNNVMLCY